MDDIYFNIFTFLNFSDIYKCCQVNKQFYKVTQMEQLWKHFYKIDQMEILWLHFFREKNGYDEFIDNYDNEEFINNYENKKFMNEYDNENFINNYYESCKTRKILNFLVYNFDYRDSKYDVQLSSSSIIIN